MQKKNKRSLYGLWYILKLSELEFKQKKKRRPIFLERPCFAYEKSITKKN